MKPRWILAFALVALAAYHIPWHTHRVAAFSNNAFDLAEMMSLHPQVQAESPRLYTSLLLRLPLIFLAAVVVLAAGHLQSRYWQWGWYGVAGLIVLRLNPPAVFYPYGGGSWNDQQLGNLMLVGLGVVGGMIVLNHWLKRWATPLMMVALGGMLYTALAGYQRATDIVQHQLGLKVEMGGGLILFIGASLAMGMTSLFEYRLGFRSAHPENEPLPIAH